MSHPRLQGTPLLSRISKSSNGNGQKMKVVCRLSEAVALIADNDHRAAAASFQGEGLDDAWVFVLASSLETNDTMRSLNLNNNLVGDRGSRALAQSLYLNSHLRMLSLGGNRITDAGASSLADLLRSGICNLTGLDLSGPKPIMTRSVGLDEYGVGQSRVVDIIRAPGATALALALDNSLGNPPCPLVTLNLSDQRILDAGVIALASALQCNSHLQVLGLACTGITDTAAEALAKTIAKSRSLSQLDLSHNCITDTGAFHISKGLTDQGQKMDLACNNSLALQAGEGTARQSGCAENVCRTSQGFVRAIDLSTNSIGETGVQALHSALIVLPNLLSLEVYGNCLNAEHTLLTAIEALTLNRRMRALSQGQSLVPGGLASPPITSKFGSSFLGVMVKTREKMKAGLDQSERERSMLASEQLLPIRGYYTSQVLDSKFNSATLREPAPDPTDPSIYVNHTRDNLQQLGVSIQGKATLKEQDSHCSLKAGRSGGHKVLGVPTPKGVVGASDFLNLDMLRVLMTARRL